MLNLQKHWQWLLCIVTLIPLFFVNLGTSHDWGGDFAMYIIQARNLVEGIPQSDTGYIYNPEFIRNGPPNYPIGFSLLLAPLYAIWGNNMVVFLIFQTTLAFIFGLILFAFARQHMNWLPAIVITLILVYNPWVLEFKREVKSEFAFMIFMMLFLISLKKQHPPAIIWLWAVLTVMCRAVGWLVIPTLIIPPVLGYMRFRGIQTGSQRMIRAVIIAIATIATVFVLDQFVFRIESSAEAYFDQIVEFRIFENAWINLVYVKDCWTYHMLGFLDRWGVASSIPFILFAVLMIIGIIRSWNRSPYHVWFLIGYVAILLFYPYTRSGFRFLLPIIGLTLIFSVMGMQTVLPKFRLRATLLALLAVLYMTSHNQAWAHIIKYQDMIRQGPQHPDSEELFRFIDQNTQPTEPILFSKPRPLSLYTDRSSVVNHPDCGEEKFIALIEKHNVKLLLTNRFMSNSTLDTFISNRPSTIDPIFENDSFIFYRIKE